MKKLVLLITTALVFTSVSPVMVAAQTTTEADTIAALQAQIASLLEQITQMNQQIASMQVENQAVREELQTVREEFRSYLRIGVENEEVRMLQEFLAEDESIYPEGLITGYFGPLTAAAVKNFQKKYDIEQVGVVGPQTRGKLNSLWKVKFESKSDNGKSEAKVSIKTNIDAMTNNDDDDDDDDDDKWEYEYEWEGKWDDDDDDDDWDDNYRYKWGKSMVLICHKPDMSNEQTLLVARAAVQGHLKHGDYEGPCGDDNGGDTAAPVISALAVTSVTETSARILWNTNESADSTVEYSTDANLSTGVITISSSLYIKSHDVSLSGLTASTTYYYRVTSEDLSGNAATSGIQSFDTDGAPAPADTTAPVISNVAETGITETSATITWDTDENADSLVEYSTTADLSADVISVSDATFVMSHSVALSGLTASTTYYYRVTSEDAASNAATSSIESFTTDAPAPADTTAPVLSNIAVTQVSTTSVSVTWDTDEAADSKVYYGTSTPLDLGTATTVDESVDVTSHSLLLDNLATSTTYYFVVESEDAASNKATSAEDSFTTPSE